jgi:phage gp46-like protein
VGAFQILAGPQGQLLAGPQGGLLSGPLGSYSADGEQGYTAPISVRGEFTGDVALLFDTAQGVFDIAIDGGDLVRDAGVATSVIVSLLTDSRASDEDIAADEDPRGWWGEEDSQFGSLLWLLQRAKRVERSLEIARESTTRALAWMVAAGVAERIAVTPRWERAILVVSVDIYRGVSRRWASVWDHMEQGLYKDQGVQLELKWR